MKKMFTLLLSLMAFSALFAQYQRPDDNRYYNERNATYNGRSYSDNNTNTHYIPQPTAPVHNNGAFQDYNHRGGFDGWRNDNARMEDDHRGHDFGYPDRYHERDDWRRNHHRGLGLLGTGLVIGGVIGVVIASH